MQKHPIILHALIKRGESIEVLVFDRVGHTKSTKMV